MRTLRAALASTTPPRSTPRLYGLAVLTVRLPETAVRRQPKPLYAFDRFGCTASAVLRVRLPPKRPSVFARIAQLARFLFADTRMDEGSHARHRVMRSLARSG